MPVSQHSPQAGVFLKPEGTPAPASTFFFQPASPLPPPWGYPEVKLALSSDGSSQSICDKSRKSWSKVGFLRGLVFLLEHFGWTILTHLDLDSFSFARFLGRQGRGQPGLLFQSILLTPQECLFQERPASGTLTLPSPSTVSAVARAGAHRTERAPHGSLLPRWPPRLVAPSFSAQQPLPELPRLPGPQPLPAPQCWHPKRGLVPLCTIRVPPSTFSGAGEAAWPAFWPVTILRVRNRHLQGLATTLARSRRLVSNNFQNETGKHLPKINVIRILLYPPPLGN